MGVGSVGGGVRSVGGGIENVGRDMVVAVGRGGSVWSIGGVL